MIKGLEWLQHQNRGSKRKSDPDENDMSSSSEDEEPENGKNEKRLQSKGSKRSKRSKRRKRNKQQIQEEEEKQEQEPQLRSRKRSVKKPTKKRKRSSTETDDEEDEETLDTNTIVDEKALAHDREKRALHWMSEEMEYDSHKTDNAHLKLPFDKTKFRLDNFQSVDASFLESPEQFDPKRIQRITEREKKIWSSVPASSVASTASTSDSTSAASGSSSSLPLSMDTSNDEDEKTAPEDKNGKDEKKEKENKIPDSTKSAQNLDEKHSSTSSISNDQTESLDSFPDMESYLSVEDSQFVNPLKKQGNILKQCYGKERSNDISQKTLRDIVDVWTQDPRESDYCQGDNLIELASELLDAFKQVRSADQTDITNAILTICEPQIYAQDFDRKRIEILRKQQKKAFAISLLVMTPRRWGKTLSVAMAMAVLLYVCRKVNIVTFATGLFDVFLNFLIISFE